MTPEPDRTNPRLLAIDRGETALPLEVPRPGAAAPATRAPRSRLLLAGTLGLGLVAGWGIASLDDAGVPPDAASLGGRADPPGPAIPAEAALPVVLGLGRLMPEGDLIRVSPPFGAGDARVSGLLVAQGDHVEQGALLATLDNLPALESGLLSAESLVAQREASLAQARETVRINRLEAQAAAREAQAAAHAAEARLARARELVARGVTTAANLEDVDSAAIQATQALARAEAALARWDTGDIETQPDVVVARSNLAAARIDADRAARDLAKAEVRAPIAGRVLEVHVRPGERPGSDGLVTLGRTDRMMARVEVFQTEIGRIREGQPVELTAAPLEGALTGHVESVGLVVGRQNLVSDDTAANTDARVVEVLVRLDPESSERAARLSNLETLARIATDAPS